MHTQIANELTICRLHRQVNRMIVEIVELVLLRRCAYPAELSAENASSEAGYTTLHGVIGSDHEPVVIGANFRLSRGVEVWVYRCGHFISSVGKEA